MGSKRFYSDPRWQQVRKAVLVRDEYRCQLKRHKCKGTANEVDHIVAVSDGGAQFDPANLRSACKSCNIGQRNERIAQIAKAARAGESIAARAVSSHNTLAWTPDNPWPTRAEFVAYYGYGWSGPPYGWRPDHLPLGTPPPISRR